MGYQLQLTQLLWDLKEFMCTKAPTTAEVDPELSVSRYTDSKAPQYQAWQPISTDKATIGTKAPYYGSSRIDAEKLVEVAC